MLFKQKQRNMLLVLSMVVLLLFVFETQTVRSGELRLNKVAITSLKDGDTIGCTLTVKGTINRATANNDGVWVFVHRKVLKNQWWPEPQANDVGNNWEALATVGIKEDIGADFEIAVATFDKNSEKIISDYFKEANKTGRFPPMEFPSTTSNVDIVTVKKISHDGCN
ncbi:MAG: hypothetical protein HQL03_02700 [Nitrospirae bacterium]|nr:hypothetical protein [Nitrospirota bacterium]MBF0591874.1 hypothetical protein [Nitrospirota bacterium]